jgi:3-oxoacyl-[acyl-carrier protein] reductase
MAADGDRTVVVTGASRGLGLAIATTLSRSGFKVVGVARSESLGFAKARQALAGALHFQACDLSDIAALPALARSLRAAHGPLYGLVNNAGIGTAGVLATMAEAKIEELVRLNLTSPMVLTKYVVRQMMTLRRGRIVILSSVAATSGFRGLSAYSATKAALIGFTRSLAREVGELGITVNAVAPGFVATEMTHDLDEAERGQIARRSALKRMAEPQDVADAVDYLMSDRADSVTGTVLTVDAGATA